METPACIFDELDTAFGSLWWVREAEWSMALRNYASRRNRKSHPGLSLNEASESVRLSYVLMLHGRSERRNDCVAVRGLTRQDPDHIAYFGHIGPAKINSRLFTSFTKKLEHDDPNWIRRAAVIRNHDKPYITSQEEAELRRWWDRKRARQHWWNRDE
jgi:hypothetical protein